MTAQEAADVLEACFNLLWPRPLRKDCLEALAVLRDAAQDCEKLREALRPLAHPYSYGEPIDVKHTDIEIDCCVSITYDDVARARAALGERT